VNWVWGGLTYVALHVAGGWLLAAIRGTGLARLGRHARATGAAHRRHHQPERRGSAAVAVLGTDRDRRGPVGDRPAGRGFDVLVFGARVPPTVLARLFSLSGGRRWSRP